MESLVAIVRCASTREVSIAVEADAGAADLMTLRDLAEFEVNSRLLAVPGVAAVERLGGCTSRVRPTRTSR